MSIVSTVAIVCKPFREQGVTKKNKLVPKTIKKNPFKTIKV